MTGVLYLCDGQEVELPTLLRWTLIRTDGAACDSFSVAFCYQAEWEAVLRKAVRFRAVSNGVTRFFGIVDEYEAVYNARGLEVTVLGRGMAGLLMDNQVGLREYYWVRLSDILRNYVTPYGVTASYEKNYFLQSYAVDYGTSAWQALTGFCLWAGNIQPRCSADGTLIISEKKGKTVSLSHPERVIAAQWNSCRYGVYSKVVAKNAATKLETAVTNKEFLAMGGNAVRRITIPRKNSCRAGKVSAEMELKASTEKARVLRLTLADPFFSEPGDRVTLELSRLGIQGDFYVSEVETSLSSDGTICRLTMEERR